MSFKAEFWRLQVEPSTIVPTLQFQIQVSNDTPGSRFNIISYQARVACRPDDRHYFNLGQTPVSIETKQVSSDPSLLRFIAFALIFWE